MNPLLESWLEDLRETPLVLREALGSGGRENLWTLSIPEDIGEEELVWFLEECARIRLAQAAGPAMFYVWHDEQAGHLRFSVARGRFQDLPFGARLERVPHPRAIVREYLSSPYRDGIPWDTLRVLAPGEKVPDPPPFIPRVWAVTSEE